MKVESLQPRVREVALPVGVGLGPAVNVASGMGVLTISKGAAVFVAKPTRVSVAGGVLLGLAVTVIVALGTARAALVNWAESVSVAAV